MRELSFRGKRLDNGEWVDGGSIFKLINKSGEHFFIPRFNEKVIATHDDNMNIIALEGCILYKVDPETVGEYTGLRDCKRTEEYPEGQMIFEGDIVTIPDSKKMGLPAPIRYDYVRATFEVSRSGYNPLSLIDAREFYEVIGNIHDHPQLLKEGGE